MMKKKNLWNLLLDNSFYQKEYFKSEFTISCKIEDYWIGGRIDAIVRDDNKYYILDYKTGSIPKILNMIIKQWCIYYV